MRLHDRHFPRCVAECAALSAPFEAACALSLVDGQVITYGTVLECPEVYLLYPQTEIDAERDFQVLIHALTEDRSCAQSLLYSVHIFLNVRIGRETVRLLVELGGLRKSREEEKGGRVTESRVVLLVVFRLKVTPGYWKMQSVMQRYTVSRSYWEKAT